MLLIRRRIFAVVLLEWMDENKQSNKKMLQSEKDPQRNIKK